jgi:hypothetical protein
VNDAMVAGRGIDPASELGRQFTAFAAGLAGSGPRVEAAPAPRHRFLEFFSVGPTSAGLERH